MEIHFCTNTFIPLRLAPAHRAEMVSQILFGERFTITETSGGWAKVQTLFDSYTGWIDAQHGGFEPFITEEAGVIIPVPLTCKDENGALMRLSPGSEVFGLDEGLTGFSVAGKAFTICAGDLLSAVTGDVTLAGCAELFINSPYLWGGRTIWGIDCSGLVQIAAKIAGIVLPRDAAVQSSEGITVDFISDALPGDLLFFSGDTERITHTGVMAENSTVIHASGRVRCDMVDHQGIWNAESGKYSHSLRVIKRII